MYWQSSVSSRLTHKERGIHTRFSVFILGVQFHCMLLVATKMQVLKKVFKRFSEDTFILSAASVTSESNLSNVDPHCGLLAMNVNQRSCPQKAAVLL